MIAQVRQFVIAHFEAYRRMGKWPFFWGVGLEGLLVPLALGQAVTAIFHLSHRADLDGWGLWKLLLGAVVVGPFVETVCLQVFPIMLVRRAGSGFWVQVFVSTVVFAAGHFSSGPATIISAGLLSGFYLAFTYARWRQESLRNAVWMTTGVHAFHNLIVVGIIGLVR